MRKMLAVTAVVALLGAIPLGAEETAEPLQTVEGSVAVPIPRNVTGVPRRAALVGSPTNGVVGWAFDVPSDSWGGMFKLERTVDPSGVADFDILFYDNVGSLTIDPPNAVGTFATAGTGGETGEIPAGAVKALVYLGANGANASFKYTGFAPPPATTDTSDTTQP